MIISKKVWRVTNESWVISQQENVRTLARKCTNSALVLMGLPTARAPPPTPTTSTDMLHELTGTSTTPLVPPYTVPSTPLVHFFFYVFIILMFFLDFLGRLWIISDLFSCFLWFVVLPLICFGIFRSSWGSMLHLEKVREVKRYTPRESEELAFSLEGPEVVSRRSLGGPQVVPRRPLEGP